MLIIAILEILKTESQLLGIISFSVEKLLLSIADDSKQFKY